jgi:hypothetical protein
MWSVCRRSKESTVRLCEHCARVCDDTCRRAAMRDRVLRQQTWRGVA